MPHYMDVIAAKAYLLSGFKKGKFLNSAIAAACDDEYESLRVECDDLDEDVTKEARRNNAVAMVAMREGMDRVIAYANANASVSHSSNWEFKDILCGTYAVSYLFEGFLTGRYSIDQVASQSWRDTASVVQSIFVSGCIASYGGYNACLVLEIPGWIELSRRFKKEGNCLVCSELLYSDIPVGQPLRHWSEVMNDYEVTDVDILKITRGRAANLLTGLEFHCLGGLLVLRDLSTGKLCYPDNLCRTNLCTALLSVGQTALYALTYRLHDVHDISRLRERAIITQTQIFDYIRVSLGGFRADANKVAAFAKHVKASYTAILNRIELKGVNKDKYDIANSQFEAANVFANELRDRPVTRVFGQVDIKLYADLGTFWNMLPPPDIDSLDHRIEGDYNSDKNFNHEFQDMFHPLKVYAQLDTWVRTQTFSGSVGSYSLGAARRAAQRLSHSLTLG